MRNLKPLSKLLLPLLPIVLVTAAYGQRFYSPLMPPPNAPIFHPTGPMPAFEVATIKKAAPGSTGGAGTIKFYIMSAYGVFADSRIVGGPDWISKDEYMIEGKESDETREAIAKMPPQQRLEHSLMLRRSLLADRFKLKMHFETRTVPTYDLVPARSGLKIKEVPPPPPPGTSQQPLPPGETLHPGAIRTSSGAGIKMFNARAITMAKLIGWLNIQPEADGRLIEDKTGFKGCFDIRDLTAGEGNNTNGPSLFTALEETLGLKLVPSKGQTEVVVIDSIDRPSEN